jgi:hypothetical protein
LRALVEVQPGTDDHGKPRPRLIPLAADAKLVYVAWHDAHGRDVADIHAEDLAAHFAKLKGSCIRLALIFACVDAALSGESIVAIGREHIECAIAVMDWFKGEARRVYGVLGEDDDERNRRRLVELIGRKGGAITVRELQQASRLFRRTGDAEAALTALAEAGLGRWEERGPGARGGRPTRIFHLNTPAPADTTPPNEAPTKPPTATPQGGCVDVGSVDVPEADGCDWGKV